MKFPFLCQSCVALNPVEYKADNHYNFQCQRCKQMTEAIIRKVKFELLFDFGSWAFLNGYYREAVANFATALERFFEFWVRTIRHKQSVSEKYFEKTWKALLSKSSERQLGAFAMLYLFETGKYPEFLDSNKLKTNLRNDVVHAGKIPSRDEAVGYADLIHGLIRSLLIELYDIAPVYVTAELKSKEAQVGDNAHAKGYRFAVYAFDGMFGIDRFSPEKKPRLTRGIRQTKLLASHSLALVATNTCAQISTSKQAWRPGNGSSISNFTRSKKGFPSP